MGSRSHPIDDHEDAVAAEFTGKLKVLVGGVTQDVELVAGEGTGSPPPAKSVWRARSSRCGASRRWFVRALHDRLMRRTVPVQRDRMPSASLSRQVDRRSRCRAVETRSPGWRAGRIRRPSRIPGMKTRTVSTGRGPRGCLQVRGWAAVLSPPRCSRPAPAGRAPASRVLRACVTARRRWLRRARAAGGRAARDPGAAAGSLHRPGHRRPDAQDRAVVAPRFGGDTVFYHQISRRLRFDRALAEDHVFDRAPDRSVNLMRSYVFLPKQGYPQLEQDAALLQRCSRRADELPDRCAIRWAGARRRASSKRAFWSTAALGAWPSSREDSPEMTLRDRRDSFLDRGRALLARTASQLFPRTGLLRGEDPAVKGSDVIVVGAGIGGLAALALLRAPASGCGCWSRSPNWRGRRRPRITPNAGKAIAALGLRGELERFGSRPPAGAIRHYATGEILGAPRAGPGRRALRHPIHHVHRARTCTRRSRLRCARSIRAASSPAPRSPRSTRAPTASPSRFMMARAQAQWLVGAGRHPLGDARASCSGPIGRTSPATRVSRPGAGERVPRPARAAALHDRRPAPPADHYPFCGQRSIVNIVAIAQRRAWEEGWSVPATREELLAEFADF